MSIDKAAWMLSKLNESNILKTTKHSYDNYDVSDVGALTSSGYYNKNTGQITAGTVGYKYAAPYPVNAGEIYRISGTVSYNANLYIIVDESSNILDVYPNTNEADKVYNNHDFKIPANGKYLLINSLSGNTKLEKYKSTTQKDLKIGIIGDSISDKSNGYVVNQYVDYLNSIDGFGINNVSVSGSGYKRKFGTSQAFYQKALTLDSDCDLVLIMGSFNDLEEIVGGLPVGVVTDTDPTVSMCGAINSTISNIRTTCYGSKIGVITPPPWGAYTPSDSTSSNQILYVNAIIEVSKHRGVPVLDFFRESNMTPWDTQFKIDYLYKRDSVHPNGLCHQEYIYPMVREFINKMK